MGRQHSNTESRPSRSSTQIEYIVGHCGLVFDETSPIDSDIPDDRSLFLGDDANGVAIEVAALDLESGDLVIVHAMKLRARYRTQYIDAIAHRKRP